MTVASCQAFDVAVFILPGGKSLPLHDHPKMTVLSKLLTGGLSVRAYTPDPISPKLHLLALDTVKLPEHEGWFLTPTQGNIHEFAAVDTAVILDVLMPPYDEDKGRPCNYYTASPEGGAWRLSAAPEPASLPMGTMYFGYRPSLRSRLRKQ